jgi:lipid II:glycine glycyltransferase (peptidoglycan interpeptide bridge formation enzyme)
MWASLKNSMAYLLIAEYRGKPLVAWILFIFNNVLYYPYGASSNEHREVMASNLMMWEAIRFGKKMKCGTFDMWGSLGPNPDPSDPWYGFHRFKEGYGGTLTEFVGSFDLIINPFLYQLYNLAHHARWVYLRIKKI